MRLLPDCDCRICGRMRPFEKIKTVVRKAEGPFEYQVNVNYCVDNRQCYKLALEKADQEVRRMAGNATEHYV